MRDLWGNLTVRPESLDRAGRVDCLRRLAGQLQAGDGAEGRWLGRALLRWLHGAPGDDLAAALGIAAGRGSHATPQALARRDRVDELLLELRAAAGDDATASRILRGVVQCPPACRELVAELRALGAPRSASAFARARHRR